MVPAPVPSTSPTTSGSNCSTTATTIPKPFVRERARCSIAHRRRLLPPTARRSPKACSGPPPPRQPSTCWLDTFLAEGFGRPCKATSRAASAASVFDDDRKDELQERPASGAGGRKPRRWPQPTPQGPIPSRWTLNTIRASFDWLGRLQPSAGPAAGCWTGSNLGPAFGKKVQQFSPDPDYLRQASAT